MDVCSIPMAPKAEDLTEILSSVGYRVIETRRSAFSPSGKDGFSASETNSKKTSEK